MGRIRFVQKKYKSETGESMGKPNKKLKKMLIVLGVTGAVYGVFRFLLPLVTPFFAAWGLAVLFRPSAVWLAARLRREVSLFGRKWVLGVPVGLIGVAELLGILVILLAAAYVGSRKLCLELVSFMDQIPIWIDALDGVLTGWCHQVEGAFQLKNDCLVILVREMLKGLLESMKQAAMPFVMANSMTVFRCGAKATVFVALTVVAAGLAMQEMEQWKQRMGRSIYRKELELICKRLSMVANAYLKTQGILFMLISFVCIVSFWFLGNPYYILAGLGTGFLDALPVFGTGTVLVPWAALLFFARRWKKGAALLVLYLACYFLRQVLESRLMGRQVGLTPFEELAALIVGLRLFGILGLLLGPMGFLLSRDLAESIELEAMEAEAMARRE